MILTTLGPLPIPSHKTSGKFLVPVVGPKTTGKVEGDGETSSVKGFVVRPVDTLHDKW